MKCIKLLALANAGFFTLECIRLAENEKLIGDWLLRCGNKKALNKLKGVLCTVLTPAILLSELLQKEDVDVEAVERHYTTAL